MIFVNPIARENSGMGISIIHGDRGAPSIEG